MNQYQQPNQQGQPIIINNTQKKGVNHTLHFILTLVTLGLWLPVWIIVAIAN